MLISLQKLTITAGFIAAILSACSAPPEERDLRDAYPPLIKGSGTLLGVSFQLPVPLTQLYRLERNPVTGKVIHRSSDSESSQYLVLICETNAPVLAPAAGKVLRISRMAESPSLYQLELLHAPGVKTRLAGLMDPVVQIGTSFAAATELGRTAGRLEISLWVDLNYLGGKPIDRFIHRIRKGGHWHSVFPLMLLFGKGVYDAKDYR